MAVENVSYGYRFAFMFLIIAINGFFAAAETALVSVRPSRLRQMADEGQVGAHAAISLLANPERLLSVSQVGLTLASLGLGWLGEETLYGFLHSIFAPIITDATRPMIGIVSLVLAFLLMTFTHVVLGEVVPKNIAMDRADRLAVIVAPILLVFYKIAEPFVWIIERASAAASRALGVHGHQHGAHSPEELKFVVTASQAAGHLTEFEEEAIRHIVDLQDYNVREVMVPRSQLVTVTMGADIDEVLDLMRESRYSRLPVCPAGADNPIGFVHVKDVLDYWARRRQSNLLRRATPSFALNQILRKAPIVPETRALHLVLDDLRENRAHVAFVVDEYGMVSGLVSLEDVFEQVFGEIQDEFDLEAPPPEEESPSFDVEGTIPIRDLAMQFGIEIPSGDEFETLAGYLLFRFGCIPEAGDAVEYGDRRFTVVEMDFNLIARVRIDRITTEEPVSGE
ncbi:MAG TPA: hemolysin family protein [Paludibaculum sp.]|jgi:CBS domain containing-hemolysin-like protein